MTKIIIPEGEHCKKCFSFTIKMPHKYPQTYCPVFKEWLHWDFDDEKVYKCSECLAKEPITIEYADEN